MGLKLRNWKIINMATKKEKANQEKMLKALKKLGGVATAAQLVEKTGFNKSVANETAKALVKAGKIRAAKGGKVELVTADKAPAKKEAPAPSKKKSKPAPEEDDEDDDDEDEDEDEDDDEEGSDDEDDDDDDESDDEDEDDDEDDEEGSDDDDDEESDDEDDDEDEDDEESDDEDDDDDDEDDDDEDEEEEPAPKKSKKGHKAGSKSKSKEKSKPAKVFSLAFKPIDQLTEDELSDRIEISTEAAKSLHKEHPLVAEMLMRSVAKARRQLTKRP